MDLVNYFQVTAAIDFAPIILAVSSILGVVGGIFAPIFLAWSWMSRNSINALQKQLVEVKLELNTVRKAAEDAREKYEKRQEEDASTIMELKIRIDGFPARIEFLEKLVLELQNQILAKDKIIAEKVV